MTTNALSFKFRLFNYNVGEKFHMEGVQTFLVLPARHDKCHLSVHHVQKEQALQGNKEQTLSKSTIKKNNLK